MSAKHSGVVQGQLHEFMGTHREELLEMCKALNKQSAPDRTDAEVVEGLAPIVDHIIAALSREAGVADDSPLPDQDPAAAEFADRHRLRGFPIAIVALHIGGISNAVGALGDRYAMCFRAREYQVFNQCIDSVMATAMERYLAREREAHDHDATERIGFIAHELRNALSTARMAYTMLQTGQVGMSSRTAKVLDRALGRLEHLVEQTLLDAHLRSRIPLQAVRVELHRLLHDIVDAIPTERGISIAVELEEELQLLLDERLLVSAVSNLLQNAVKFTHDGGTIVLRARNDSSLVAIEVEDECGGLTTDPPEKLFEAHAQAGADRRGYGLGLAITREAIERLGGELFIHNLPGKGCVFGLRLRP